jgi:hypothetical protein
MIANMKTIRVEIEPPDAPDPAEIDRLAKELLDKESSETASVDDSSTLNIEKLYEKYSVRPAISNAVLRRSTSKNEYMIDGVLVRNQPGLIGGASKSLKTTTAIDLAVSLASGSPFLGVRSVLSQEKVMFYSAESGEATIREIERRVSMAKGVYDQLDNDQIIWQTWVPQISDLAGLALLDYEIGQHKPTVVILDPLYQMLDGENASSYSLNGQQLQTISRLCLDHNATPILIDHAKRSSNNVREFAPLELEDISGAGKAEFFRQWILISRQRPYDVDSQIHHLWMTFGGSAGHSGLFGVVIDESLDESSGRGYRLTVQSGRESKESMSIEIANRKREKDEKQKAATLESHCEKILLAFVGNLRLTKSKIGTLAGMNDKQLAPAIAKLLSAKKIDITEEKIQGVMRDVYYRP